MLDTESGQMFKLNPVKSNSSQFGSLIRVEQTLGQIMPANTAVYPVDQKLKAVLPGTDPSVSMSENYSENFEG